MTGELIIALVFGFVGVVSSVIGATWVLSNKINGVRDSLTLEISTLKSQIEVMRAREEAREEKLDQLWKWWLTTIENGWVAHMKAVAAGGKD